MALLPLSRYSAAISPTLFHSTTVYQEAFSRPGSLTPKEISVKELPSKLTTLGADPKYPVMLKLLVSVWLVAVGRLITACDMMFIFV